MEQYNFSTNKLEWDEYVPFNKERFPFVWKNRSEFSAKWNSTIFSTNKPHISSKSMVLVWWRKWYSDIPIIPVKPGKEEYLWRYSVFPKISIVKNRFIWYPIGTAGFPHKRKALLVLIFISIWLTENGVRYFNRCLSGVKQNQRKERSLSTLNWKALKTLMIVWSLDLYRKITKKNHAIRKNFKITSCVRL